MTSRSTAVVRSHPPAPPIVFVVDDDVSVREALEGMLRFAGWQVETFGSAEAFLARTRGFAVAQVAHVPSCLILDLTLPALDGLALQQRLAADMPGVPIIFLTGFGDVPTSVKAMKAGAVEFLTKPFDDTVLLAAIESALAGATERAGLQQRFASLSPREREVMRLVVSGLLNKQVGAELGISEPTVKAHRGKVMRKMHAGSLAELVKMAAALRVRTAES